MTSKLWDESCWGLVSEVRRLHYSSPSRVCVCSPAVSSFFFCSNIWTRYERKSCKKADFGSRTLREFWVMNDWRDKGSYIWLCAIHLLRVLQWTRSRRLAQLRIAISLISDLDPSTHTQRFYVFCMYTARHSIDALQYGIYVVFLVITYPGGHILFALEGSVVPRHSFWRCRQILSPWGSKMYIRNHKIEEITAIESLKSCF